MAQSLLDAIAVDNHTVMAVQSLLESQSVQETLRDEEDVFQCGKCKRNFTSLPQFLAHKQNQCVVAVPTSTAASSASTTASVDNTAMTNTNVIYTAQLAHPQPNKQITLPANAYMVPLQNFSQGMLLTEDMISFHGVSNAAALQLPVHNGANQFLATNEVVSSTEDRKQMSRPETSPLCAYISSTAYPANESCILQSHNDVTVTELANAPNVINQMDLFGRLNKRFVVPLPTIQAVASIQLPASQGGAMLPDTASASALVGTHNNESTTTVVVASSDAVSRPQQRVKPSIVEASSTSAAPRVLHCQYCDKSFMKNFDLQQHTRSHTGEKPFQCIVCGRAFAQKSNVKKHLQTHKVWPQGMSRTLPGVVTVMDATVGSSAEHGGAVIGTSETVSTSSTPSSGAVVPVTAEASNAASADVSAPTSSMAGGDIHIVVDKHALSEGGSKSEDGSIHIVVDDKTSSSRVVRTMIRVNPSAAENQAQKVDIVVDNSYVCQYCSMKFTNYFQLKSHMINHKDEQVYKCVVKSCGESFQVLDAFLEHIRLHENQMSYRCHQCNKQFQSLADLGMHQYTHSLYPNQGRKAGPKYFRCGKCNNKYASPEALQHHLETTSHVYNCPNCPKVFTCERYLRRHLTTHGTVTNYVCWVCQKSFKTEHYLKMHMVIHSKDKPFQCDVCNSSFNRKDKLKRHMLIHDPVKRFMCPLQGRTGCTKAFNRPDKLKAHIIAHAGAKPYRCQTCGRTFTRRPHLREHEQFHAKNFRFWCECCNQGFMRQSFLKQHKCTGTTPSSVNPRQHTLRRKVGRPRKNLPLPADSSGLVTDKPESVVTRQGRSAKKNLVDKAASVKDVICSHNQDTSTAVDEAVMDKQRDIGASGDVGASHSDAVVSLESSEVCSDVKQVLVETAAVDCTDAVDIPGTVAISSLENGTLYVLQPVESIAQDIGCRTLRLLSGTNDEEQSTTAVLLAASSGDVISTSADLAHLLRSAGIAGVEAEPASQAESTT